MIFASNNLCLYLEITPAMLLTPTIHREYVVAKTGSIWKKYTKTGTVKIEPPLPTKPRDMPISVAKKYPIICIVDYLNKNR